MDTYPRGYEGINQWINFFERDEYKETNVHISVRSDKLRIAHGSADPKFPLEDWV